MTGHVATAETDIDAPVDDVWEALTEPKLIEKYMFGTHVSLSQDNNASAEAAEHSKRNWEQMLSGLKETVEAR